MGRNITFSIVAMRKNGIPLYDLHGHFLPGMDDGCKTVEESIQVLKSSWSQGVRAMFATPHYYPRESVDAFLKRRKAAAMALWAHVQKANVEVPVICLGAEVAYRSGIVYEEQLAQLCLGHSNYLLLELPFVRWSSEVLRDVYAIQNVRGITPVLAHIERYFGLQDKATIADILDSEVLIQMNGEYLLNSKTRRRGRILLESGAVQLLGSDCHNMTKRPPNLGQAASYLEKRGMDATLYQISRLGREIFQQALGEESAPI